MAGLDLGELRREIEGVPPDRLLAAISGIPRNLHALAAVMKALQKLGIHSGQILSLGDIFGYGPDPVGCVKWAAPFGVNLYGNHDCFVEFEYHGLLAQVVGPELYDEESFQVDRQHAR